MEATSMSINRGMDEEVVVHIQWNITQQKKRNIFEPVLVRWLNLEPLIQSEVNQKQKKKYHILMHIYEI